MNSNEIQWIIGRIEQLERRITWIEQLLMKEGRELFSDTATHVTNWDHRKDV